jgi:predicted MFS family arabinose efflux permease
MARRVRRDLAILVPSVGAQLIASTGNFILPLVVVVLISNVGLDERSSGLLVSLELTASALTTLAISAWPRPHSRRRVAVFGAALAVGGHAAALITPELFFLAATRLIAGIGAGIVAGEAAAIISRGRNRERLISSLTIAAILNGAFWIQVLPYLSDRFGYRGPYLCLLVLAVVGAVLLTRLPSPPMRAARQAETAPVDSRLFAICVMGGIVLTQLGQGAFWGLVGVYGTNAGLTDNEVGSFLSLATLLLLVGVIGTAWAGVRFGRFGPLFLLTAINALSIVAIAYVPDRTIYIAANVVQAVTNLSSVVYQLGLAAAMDRSGRLVAACSGLLNLGNGIGPSISGAVATALGAPTAGLFVLAFNAAALALYGVIAIGAARGRVAMRA